MFEFDDRRGPGSRFELPKGEETSPAGGSFILLASNSRRKRANDECSFESGRVSSVGHELFAREADPFASLIDLENLDAHDIPDRDDFRRIVNESIV